MHKTVRVLAIMVLTIIAAAETCSQTRSGFHLKNEIKNDAGDDIVVTKLFPGENKLLVVGKKSVRLWDLTGAKVVSSCAIDVPEMTEDHPRLISPNGRFMLVSGNYDSRQKRDKTKRPASVWSVETCKQLVAFDSAHGRIHFAAWSRDGSTLLTSDQNFAEQRQFSHSAEIFFWDGSSFHFLNHLPAKNIKWAYLTQDGSKLFYSVAEIKNWIVAKPFTFAGGPLRVWDIRTGKDEQTLPANVSDPEQLMRNIVVSPDERMLAFVTQPPKSKDTERNLVAFDIHKSNSSYTLGRRYEIKPAQKITNLGASFSPDGKYLALTTERPDADNPDKYVLQIYAAENGTRTAEVVSRYLTPEYWLINNQVLLFNNYTSMEAAEVSSGKRLYEHELIYDSHQDSVDFAGSSDQYTWITVDETKIMPHPNGLLFLTYSNQYVKVYDAQSGAILQTLVEPPIDTSKPVDPKKGPRLSKKWLVNFADWADNGNMIYIINAHNTSISLWTVN
ncbi:MAG TPA: hypothetical protein VE961_27170 [Pyrinomonadaceae bacterium]|nr:hypothetical protein [Pyrinomonadaceae bacterium]